MNPKTKKLLFLVLVLSLTTGIELELSSSNNMEACTILMSSFDVDPS